MLDEFRVRSSACTPLPRASSAARMNTAPAVDRFARRDARRQPELGGSPDRAQCVVIARGIGAEAGNEAFRAESLELPVVPRQDIACRGEHLVEPASQRLRVVVDGRGRGKDGDEPPFGCRRDRLVRGLTRRRNRRT